MILLILSTKFSVYNPILLKSKKIKLDTNLKIILLDHQCNYVHGKNSYGYHDQKSPINSFFGYKNYSTIVIIVKLIYFNCIS